MGFGCCRLYSEAPDRTTVQRLDVVESVRAPYVSKYSTEGFNIRGNRVVGSVALLPTAFLHWKVSARQENSVRTEQGSRNVVCAHTHTWGAVEFAMVELVNL